MIRYPFIAAASLLLCAARADAQSASRGARSAAGQPADSLPELTGVVIDLSADRVRTPFGIAAGSARVEPGAGRSATGPGLVCSGKKKSSAQGRWSAARSPSVSGVYRVMGVDCCTTMLSALRMDAWRLA